MASTKRKDSKGYALRVGECQRKDGRYSYSYTDRRGKRFTVYEKSLVDLRAREKEIRMDLDYGVSPDAANRLTLNDMYDRYIAQKYNLKETTKSNYIYTYDHFVRDGFGKMKIGDIHFTDVKKFYYELLEQNKVKANTLDNIHTQIHPTLQMAVRDDIIKKNPSDGVMTEIKRGRYWDKPKRHALTIPQQKAFMEFIQNSNEFKGWVPVITVLLGTGMRIGECLGLRWEDVDFENRLISVNHNLTDRPVGKGKYRKCERHIQTPKTAAGTRLIPVLDEVFDAFLTEYEIQKCLGFCQEEIDGYSGFIFSTAHGTLYQATAVNNAIRRAIEAYNLQETDLAKKEKRDPVLMPHFSAHSLRHTFCTRFCENETNLKVIQDIMGHADISTTMDIYAEATQEKKQEVMANLQGKIF